MLNYYQCLQVSTVIQHHNGKRAMRLKGSITNCINKEITTPRLVRPILQDKFKIDGMRKHQTEIGHYHREGGISVDMDSNYFSIDAVSTNLVNNVC